MAQLDADPADPADRIARIFEGFPHKRAHLATALDGSQCGAMYVSSPEEPLAGAIRHLAGHVFLAGDPVCGGIWAFLEAELNRREDARRPLMLIPQDSRWEEAISDRLGPAAVPVRRILMLPEPWPWDHGSSAPTFDGTEVADLSTLEPQRMVPNLWNRLRRTWGSVETFQRGGVGSQASIDSKVVSICFAVTVGAGAAPIQINTAQQHRRRGYARLVAGSYGRRCAEMNLVPHWECDRENEASYGLARSLGFAEHQEHTRYRFHRG